MGVACTEERDTSSDNERIGSNQHTRSDPFASCTNMPHLRCDTIPSLQRTSYTQPSFLSPNTHQKQPHWSLRQRERLPRPLLHEHEATACHALPLPTSSRSATITFSSARSQGRPSYRVPVPAPQSQLTSCYDVCCAPPELPNGVPKDANTMAPAPDLSASITAETTKKRTRLAPLARPRLARPDATCTSISFVGHRAHVCRHGPRRPPEAGGRW